MFTREANRKSQKLFPFDIIVGKHRAVPTMALDCQLRLTRKKNRGCISFRDNFISSPSFRNIYNRWKTIQTKDGYTFYLERIFSLFVMTSQ